jgi:hypothetical protein
MKNRIRQAVASTLALTLAACATARPLVPPLNGHLGEDVRVEKANGDTYDGLMVRADSLEVVLLLYRPTDDRFVHIPADSIKAAWKSPSGPTAKGTSDAIVVFGVIIGTAVLVALVPFCGGWLWE